MPETLTNSARGVHGITYFSAVGVSGVGRPIPE